MCQAVLALAATTPSCQITLIQMDVLEVPDIRFPPDAAALQATLQGTFVSQP